MRFLKCARSPSYCGSEGNHVRAKTCTSVLFIIKSLVVQIRYLLFLSAFISLTSLGPMRVPHKDASKKTSNHQARKPQWHISSVVTKYELSGQRAHVFFLHFQGQIFLTPRNCNPARINYRPIYETGYAVGKNIYARRRLLGLATI